MIGMNSLPNCTVTGVDLSVNREIEVALITHSAAFVAPLFGQNSNCALLQVILTGKKNNYNTQINRL